MAQFSLLKYIHKKGEPIEVYNRNTSTSGTYYDITATLSPYVSTATGASSTTELHDAAATFVSLNASLTYGDEVEIVSAPAGNVNAVGSRRTITVFNLATHVTVAPAFPDTLLGCTYRIRKLYKAGLDNKIYVEDSSVFPFSNFSIILNRGKDDEEVVWCDLNMLTDNTLHVGNNDVGTAFVSKDHAFGMTVEPAQVLIEGCNWEIIETRATGEYSVAVETECLPEPDLAGWFLHEKTPHWLMSASSGPPSAVPGTEICLSGLFPGALFLPYCPVEDVVSIGDTQIVVSADNFLRVLANKPDAHNTKNINEVFRPIILRSTTAKFAELFITTADRTASLMTNARVGDTTIVTNTQLLTAGPDNIYKVGVSGNVYPTKYPATTFSRVSTVTVTASVLDPITGWYNSVVGALTVNHFAGEALINNRTPLNLNRPIDIASGVPSATFIALLPNHPAYRYKDDMTATSETTFFTSVALPVARTDYVVCTTGRFIPRNVIGKMIYITRSSGAVEGERRRITSIGGPDNNYIFVEPDFSVAVPSNSTFCIEDLLQTADAENSATVPLGDANSAFPAALNLVNLNLYKGGHKSIFPGSYVYSQPVETKLVDQPASDIQFLRTGPDLTSAITAAAAFKFPGPRRVIAPPALPFSTSTSVNSSLFLLRDVVGLDPANPVWTAMAPGTPLVNDDSRIVGRFLQILDNQRSDWRKTFKISGYSAAAMSVTIDAGFDAWTEAGTPYRILGDSTAPAVTPLSNYIWVDYPELFPEPGQGNFTITMGRGTVEEADINIISCVSSLGPEYGKFTKSVTSPIPNNYFAGTSIELRVIKIALESGGSLPSVNGGFYCGYGHGETKLTEIENGLSNYLGDTIDPIYSGSTESHVEYVGDGSSVITLKDGLYRGPDVTLPVSNKRTVSFQTVLSATTTNLLHFSVGNVTKFPLLGDNFIDKRFQDAAIGGDLHIEVVPIASTTPVLLSFKIAYVEPGSGSGCTIAATPQLDLAAYTAPGAGATLRVSAQMRCDDHESILKEDAYVAIKHALITSSVVNRLFVNLKATATTATFNAIICDDIAPIPTALVGRAVKITDYGGTTPAAAGQVVTIVSISESVVGNGFDQINVSRNFGAAITNNTTFEILPAENPLYGPPRGNYAGTGGVYTPVSYPDGGMFLTPAYPISNSGNTRFPSGREYGVIQEYVQYTLRQSNILTLSTPHYFKYDHPPGTKINLGTGVKTTAGDGSDYRPYIFSSGYLTLLFSELVGFKNLFTAAGIECKTEETELGP